MPCVDLGAWRVSLRLGTLCAQALFFLSLQERFPLAEYSTDHWKKSLNIQILDLQYETIVEDLEQSVKEILAFCDLTWEKDCLEFYQAEKFVSTASYNQVNKPIYKDSMKRWENYSNQLARIEKILQPVMSD